MDASAMIDELIAHTPDWRGRTIAELRRIFHEADPEVVEEWKWRGAPVFSHGGIIGVVSLLKNKVKLTFQQGARLADPDGVFNNGLDGNQWRALDIAEGDVLDEEALKALIRRAVGYNVARAKPAAARRKTA